MQRYEQLRAQGVPFVLVDGFSPKVQAPFISPDDRAAMTLAVTHLASLGHTRIGLALGPKRFVPVQRKIEGFVRAMQDTLGLNAETVEQDMVQHSLYTLEGGQAATMALIDRGCTAVVCASDMMALGAIRAARQRGLSVPHDISVVGFDDSPDRVHRPAPDDGPQAGPRDGPGRGAHPAGGDRRYAYPHSEFVFMPELVVRGSTASAPGDRNRP